MTATVPRRPECVVEHAHRDTRVAGRSSTSGAQSCNVVRVTGPGPAGSTRRPERHLRRNGGMLDALVGQGGWVPRGSSLMLGVAQFDLTNPARAARPVEQHRTARDRSIVPGGGRHPPAATTMKSAAMPRNDPTSSPHPTSRGPPPWSATRSGCRTTNRMNPAASVRNSTDSLSLTTTLSVASVQGSGRPVGVGRVSAFRWPPEPGRGADPGPERGRDRLPGPAEHGPGCSPGGADRRR